MVFIEAVFSIERDAGLASRELSGVNLGSGMEGRPPLRANVLKGKQRTVWRGSVGKDIAIVFTIIGLLVVTMDVKLR